MGDPLSSALSRFAELLYDVMKTTRAFSPQLAALRDTLGLITPALLTTVELKLELDHNPRETNPLIEKIQEGEKLVKECLKAGFHQRYSYSKKLGSYNHSLLSLSQIQVQAMMFRDNTESLLLQKDTNFNMHHVLGNLRDMEQKTGSVSRSLGRGRYGWRAPTLPSGIVVSNGQLEKLRAEVVADDCGVLVVAGPSGCGKTTLVKTLCCDAEIREKFAGYIFYVTASETPELQGIVSDLFKPDLSSPQLVLQGDEDATTKLGNFWNENESIPMLIVLDDVWCASFIEKIFPFKDGGRHKVVVTSRTAFRKYKVFPVEPLNEEDAKTLFRASAFTAGGSGPSPVISDDLVNQMVACCMNHPKTLSVVGGLLNGQYTPVWKTVLKKLSQGSSVLDLYPQLLADPKRSFEALDAQLKECFLDFGLFPGNKRIAVGALLNMWAHLYSYDVDDSTATIQELSYRNLVNLIMTPSNHPGEGVNYYNQWIVTQYGLQRELAIHLNNVPRLAERSRLIINAPGEILPAYIQQVQEPMQAHILSISTGEIFSSKWCNMDVPNVRVLILNLMSESYTIPHFSAGMQNLNIVDITNHGSCPTKLKNFHFLGSSCSLSKIRLENVVISPSIFSVPNLQKLSIVRCEIHGTSSEPNIPNAWRQVVDLEIEHYQVLIRSAETSFRSFYMVVEKLRQSFGNSMFSQMLGIHSCKELDKSSKHRRNSKALRFHIFQDAESLGFFMDRREGMGNSLLGEMAYHLPVEPCC